MRNVGQHCGSPGCICVADLLLGLTCPYIILILRYCKRSLTKDSKPLLPSAAVVPPGILQQIQETSAGANTEDAELLWQQQQMKLEKKEATARKALEKGTVAWVFGASRHVIGSPRATVKSLLQWQAKLKQRQIPRSSQSVRARALPSKLKHRPWMRRRMLDFPFM